jgi:beta-mannosidase
MTSPLNGMGHGHYLNYDEQTQEEFITTLVNSRNTAYTEFGSPGAASPEYIRQYISEADYADCEPSNEVWTSHHAFLAWEPESWLRKTEAEYFFGEYRDIDDLCLKTQFIQSMCYRSYFEEMRKQWPSCSMALNWCFNEPWPTFANNSLISWPNIPKPSYYAVQAALRPQLASLRIDRHLWWAGETFHAEVWILNDSLRDLSSANVEISYSIDEDAPVFWGTLHAPFIGAQSNLLCGAVNFHLSEKGTYKIRVWLKVSGHPEMDSEYTYMCRTRALTSTEGMLNV